MIGGEKPVVISYCTTFLKPEMLHVYRQITGLHRYQTRILTRTRQNHDKFPFPSIVEMPPPRINFISRFYRKYIRKLETLVYRGEYDQLLGFINKARADLIHIYFGHTGVHLLPFLKRWEKPGIVSFHGMDITPRSHDPEYEQNLRELFRTVRFVLARSASLKRILIELGCAEEKIRLNRTGIPIQSFPRVHRTAPSNGEWQVVQVCRLIEKKGIDDSLRAFAKFRREFPRARFHVVGDGPLRESLQKIAWQLDLNGSVQFYGFRSQPYVYDLLARSHIFLHPSRMGTNQDQEGIPNSMLEAMATGLPVVATDHGGIPEAVNEGKEGFLTKEGDYETLAQSLQRIAGAPTQWAMLGASAAATVREKFEQSIQIENLERVYDEAQNH